jgi:rare lipoprotein A
MIRTAFFAALCAAVTSCSINAAAAESCVASQYGIGDGYHGKRTASGERFNTHALTAAHRTRAFASLVTVTNIATGRSVSVRINDRGPFVHMRCIDLSNAAARAIGMGGTARVRVE